MRHRAAATTSSVVTTRANRPPCSDTAVARVSSSAVAVQPNGPARSKVCMASSGNSTSCAFVLARAGLLDGRRAVTHWHLAPRLQARHPRITVEPDALFIEDDNLWTSAGTAAGIDLCLHLVRVAHGAEAAATVARSMVTAPFRTGTQAQFIEQPTPRADRDADTLAAVREYALRRLHEPLTVTDLAAHAGMAPRTFARHFTAATGTSPLRWLLDQRVAAAQRLLERTDLPMPEVARRAGFGSEVTMRQHFASRLATSPRAYRTAFSATAPSSDAAGNRPIAR